MDTTIGNLRLTVASLSQAVQSPDLGVRLQAIGSLGCMGRKSKQAVPCHRAPEMPPLMGASNTASYQNYRSEHPFTISAIRQATT